MHSIDSRARRFQKLQPLGPRVAASGFCSTGSKVVAHRLGCSASRGIFPDQGLNPCPLHWQADSVPLSHQGSPIVSFLNPRKIF